MKSWASPFAGLVALLCFILAGASASYAQRESRVALVVGNGAYQNADPLRNPVNDARAMAAVLGQAGFEVILRENVTRRALTDALSEFSGKLTPGGVGLFYYAGHGMQVRGVNYLLPVDAALSKELDLKFETLDIADVLNVLDDARVRLSLLILDACRDNPLARRFRSSASRGLAQIDAPRGTVIAYATAPGDIAGDGDASNGLYTAELLKAMVVPGLRLEDVLKQTIDGVARASGNKQTPWVNSSFRGEFYFFPSATPQPPTASAPAPAVPSIADPAEIAGWNAVAGSNNPAVYEAFLQRFPNGIYAGIARARLAELLAAARQTASAAPPPPTARTDEPEDAERKLNLGDAQRRRVQAALAIKHLDTGSADGVFGPRTRAMIAAYQKSRGEPSTGYLSAAQLAALIRETEVEWQRLEAERTAPPPPTQAAPAPVAPPPPARDAAVSVGRYKLRVVNSAGSNAASCGGGTEWVISVENGLIIWGNSQKRLGPDGSFYFAENVLELSGNIVQRTFNYRRDNCRWSGRLERL
ncbi:MAG: caspase family protein [Alphaproteobacteria bacterium]|nr:caspase family protein [Alphaproteobacteria bacterium]